jgi:hypothetical protein
MEPQNDEVWVPSCRSFQDLIGNFTELDDGFGRRRKMFFWWDQGTEPRHPFTPDPFLVLRAGTIGDHVQERKE